MYVSSRTYPYNLPCVSIAEPRPSAGAKNALWTWEQSVGARATNLSFLASAGGVGLLLATYPTALLIASSDRCVKRELSLSLSRVSGLFRAHLPTGSEITEEPHMGLHI